MSSGDMASVLEDPDFTRPVVLERGGTVAEAGGSELRFDAPESLALFVTPTSAEDREKLSVGTDQQVEYKVGAMDSRSVTEGDRLWFVDDRSEPSLTPPDGVGSAAMNPYRVGAPQSTVIDGERFAWFGLTADTRGQSVGSGGEDTDSEGSDAWVE